MFLFLKILVNFSPIEMAISYGSTQYNLEKDIESKFSCCVGNLKRTFPSKNVLNKHGMHMHTQY